MKSGASISRNDLDVTPFILHALPFFFFLPGPELTVRGSSVHGLCVRLMLLEPVLIWEFALGRQTATHMQAGCPGGHDSAAATVFGF